jgi:iron complex outermembrane receptor protein
MRLGVAVAVVCLSVIGLASADDVRASIRRPTNIPAQGLGSALQTLAKDRNFQVVYVSEEVNSLRTKGAVGEFSSEEALKQLLSGTGMTFRYLDDKTVTIVRVSSSSPTSEGSAPVSPSTAPAGSPPADSQKEEDKSLWNRFRVAQVDQRASASTPTVEKGNELASGDKRVLLEEVLVTAQKREERLKDVPISISVLGGQDLDKSTFQGVTDALNTVPGVAATTSLLSGGTEIVMRGVTAGAPTFTGQSTVAYYMDSVPFGLIKSAFLPDPDVYDLQRIEVLRGPQGTLYGASAENGVVRILTNDANASAFELKARTLLSTTDGGGGNYGGDMAINVPVIDGKLALRAVVDYQNLRGWINSPVETHVNDAELRSYRIKANAQPTEALSIGLSAWSTRDRYGAPSASTDDRIISAVIPEPISTDYDTYAFKFGYQFADVLLSSATSYLDYANEGTLDLGVYHIGIPPGFAVFSDFYSNVFSEEMNLSSAPNSSWHWTAGAFYRDGTDRTYQTVPAIVVTHHRYGSESYAVFGELGRRFVSDQLEWTLGVRYFHDAVFIENFYPNAILTVPPARTTASFNSTTPRAVLTWYPNSELTVYASYSEGFRSGLPQDAGSPEAALGFPATKPDKLYNYEIGAKADLLNKRLSIDSAVYYIDYKDIQQLLTVPIGHGLSASTLVNGQSASGVGVDFSVTARPLDALKLGLTFSWNGLTMDADVFSGTAILFSKGDRLNYSPKFTGGASADYTMRFGAGFEGRLSVSGNYTSKQTEHLLNGAIGTVVNTGNPLLVGHAALSVYSPKHWSAGLFVDNFNNNYGAVPAFGFPVAEQSPRLRPRTMGVQFDYSF